MKKQISVLLAFVLLCCLLTAACSRNEPTRDDRDDTEQADAAGERDGADEAAPPEAEADDLTQQVIDICERRGVDLTFYKTDSSGYDRTICDTIDGERDPSFQITIDAYADADAAQQAFRQIKADSQEHASSLDKVLLDDENTFAKHMEAYGSVSNLMYFKRCENCIIFISASAEEQYDDAYAIMQEIEALTAALQ